ncbi:DUF6377 domain-containing protein [Bacteroides sp. 519]|uniref:DUF6377 domain-containing protein n=1 Tax=Bacteroides sp. 519 TaxID=2302937 RepID=UPI0013D047A7|nr:DUF6377 domain-containing protein [Bacteroides sp. 519]NDV57497.1 hypothetical protein [Bacteroides sp. 519]
MKRLFLLLTLTVFLCELFPKASQDSSFRTLSQLIQNKGLYMEQKENRIAEIRKMLEIPNITPKQRYDINLQLYNEYKKFVSDSAIYYMQQNITIAKQLNNTAWLQESNLDFVSLAIIVGMYIESLNILQSINPETLSNDLLIKYYNCYKELYTHYSSNNPFTHIYKENSKVYRDSLLQVLDKQSNHYKIVYAEKLDDENRLSEAKQILQEILDKTEADTHEKAVLSYALANIYKKEGNINLQKKYYTQSAICDIKNVIKENASMHALASTLYETGDVEEAYNCIKSSMEDAMYCNARLRTYEVSQIFPIIDSAYQENVTRQKTKLKVLLLLVSLLSVFLIMAVIYVYRQMKRVARIRKELYQTNLKLNELNNDLQATVNQLHTVNKALSDVNTELSEANQIKEAYIGHFLDLCSTYINKLEKYQSTLNKKAREKKLEELYKILKSRDMIDNELKELYENFDHIFLHLYPNFVDEFNSLLQDNERFQLKPNELLNVELRIYALIRLGITDSSRIANFLHYSANTIYSYRTRVRNKAAVPREEFELMVMKIGAIKKS